MGIGLTFFGWGVALAITSVWIAPILLRRLSRSTAMLIVLPLLAIDLFVAARRRPRRRGWWSASSSADCSWVS
jgi:hypothetical protein